MFYGNVVGGVPDGPILKYLWIRPQIVCSYVSRGETGMDRYIYIESKWSLYSTATGKTYF